MKKISIIMMLAAVMMLFTQCTGSEKKGEAKEGEAQVENQENAEGEAVEAEDEEGAASEMKDIPLEFAGEKPTVKDIATALAMRFDASIIGEEEAEMESPSAIYEAMAKAVKEGKCAEGEELKVDEENGTVWFKQTYDKEASVLAVKLDGDKVIVDLRNMLDGAMNPAQFDGEEIFKVDVAKKALVFSEISNETLVDDKGELK